MNEIKEVSEISSRIDELYLEISELRKDCKHEETKVFTKYREGGYDYYAESEHITRCTICGTVLNRKYEQHSWR